MSSSFRTFPVLFALLLATAGSPAPAAPVDDGVLAGEISTERLLESVSWLADDAREGRRTGEPGAEAAAEWIAARFGELGLEPLGDDGTYLQGFEATVGVRLGEANTLSLPVLDRDLRLGRDFLPFGFSENVQDAGLVFAGYGIHAPELGYDDYAGLDVTGRVVLVLRHEPQQDDPDSPFAGTENTVHSFFRTKAETAREQGAVGMLLVNGPRSPDFEDDALVSLSREQGVGGGGLVALHVKKDIALALLERSGRDLGAWAERVDETLEPDSFVLDGVRVTLATEVEKDRRPTDNVLARLKGTDPGAGTVVVGAHYDHLGKGGEGSLAPDDFGRIHNGADDNASGTAGVLELARVLAERGPLKRDVVFVAFSGEELGLLGSAHLAANFPVPLDEVQAMINLDMVGRPTRNTVTIGGAGSSPAFTALLDRLDEASPLAVSRDASGFGASDHTSFYAKDVPVLFFFSGLHEDYHRPTDDTANLDPEGFTEVVRMVSRALVEIGDRDERILFARAREDSLGAHGATGTGGGGGYGPYFGSIPEFGDREEPGVALSGVRSGSPAEKAGVQGGDVVIRFGGREIPDLYAYTAALRDRAPGDTVEVVVLRDGAEVPLIAVLGRRE